MGLSLTGCNDTRKVDDLFVFGATKAVRSHVDVVIAVNDQAFGTVKAGGRNFLLSAYAMDAQGVQVKFKVGEGSTTDALPVALETEHTAFDVELEVPSDLMPSAAGYNFHFELVPASAKASSQLSASHTMLAQKPQSKASQTLILGTTHLSSICGGVVPGTPAGSNPVNLSLASTLSYDLVNSVLKPSNAADAVASFTALNAVLKTHQASVEAQVNLTASHNLQDFSSAIYLGLQGLILQQPALQAQVVQALATTSSNGKGVAPTAAQVQATAATFAGALQTMSTNITALDSGTNQGISQVFGNGSPAPTIPPSAPSAPVVYTPTSLSFTDKDVFATIGGTVTLVPASASNANVAYRLFLGGNDAASQPWVALGDTAPGQPSRLVVPAGTVVPQGATRIWAQNLVGGVPTGPYASIALVNRNVSALALTATAQPGQVTVTWAPVAGADSYVLYRAFGSSCDTSGTPFMAATSPFVDEGLDPKTVVTYGLTVTVDGVTSQLSEQVTATTPPEPRAPVVTAEQADETVTLTWAPVVGATSYTVYRALASGGAATTLSDSATSPYIDTTAVPGTSYHYSVTASATTYESTSAITPVAVAALAPPTAQCASTGPGIVTCDSIALPPQGDHYRYFRGTTLPLDETNFVSTGIYFNFVNGNLENGTILYYAFQTVDARGNTSALSEPLPTLPGGRLLATHQRAAVVIGQQDFVSSETGVLAANRFSQSVGGLAADSAGALYITDNQASRILGFNFIPTITTNSPADFVLGQPNFTSEDNSFAANGLKYPWGLAYGQDATSTYLFVADQSNKRVLLYPAGNTLSTHASATIAIGSAGPNDAGGQTTPDERTFASANAVSAGGGKLAVVDSAGNRVLLYNQFPTNSNVAADIVLGQFEMTTTDANIDGLNACSLSAPSAVWTDGVRLVVYDYGNARVLVYNTWPTYNYAPADVVIGQPTMTTNISNGGDGTFAGSLAGGAAEGQRPGLSSNGVQLAIADPGNNRVLVYNKFPTGNNQSADVIVGQPDEFTVDTLSPPNQSSLTAPMNVLLWGTHNLLVSDTGNNRVLVY